jgi:bifunctional non-homologous end joining protein LigD
MALEEYKKKRDFSKTPEPAGRVTRRAGPQRFFCVQKHLASHLHYDFRLEHGGVLLSWAVPKGPSLDPGTKRLAMQTEDHPLDYGEFEGVIPEGYGAGIVMLWDRGTWTPESDDVEAALKRGDLKFTLDGYKLKGSWVLVRTKGWGSGTSDGRSWLLIKHRDDWAGDVDIAEFAPLSVKSKGDFASILSHGDPDVWRSNRPAQGGDTGALFEKIVARALDMQSDRSGRSRSTAKAAGTKRTPAAAGKTKRAGATKTKRAAAATTGRAPATKTKRPATKAARTTKKR